VDSRRRSRTELSSQAGRARRNSATTQLKKVSRGCVSRFRAREQIAAGSRLEFGGGDAEAGEREREEEEGGACGSRRTSSSNKRSLAGLLCCVLCPLALASSFFHPISFRDLLGSNTTRRDWDWDGLGWSSPSHPFFLSFSLSLGCSSCRLFLQVLAKETCHFSFRFAASASWKLWNS
jgi:hypothetical protein